MAGDAAALWSFLALLEERGAPLVEELPGTPGERVVTFVAHEADDAVDVVLVANRVTGPEAYEASVLRTVPGSHVRTLSLAAGAGWRSQYSLGRVPRSGPPALSGRARTMVERSLAAGSTATRATLERWWAAFEAATPDPLHRRSGSWAEHVVASSWVELPAAPPAPALLPLPDWHRRLVQVEHTSTSLGTARRVWLYRPPEAATSCGRSAGTLVLSDGEEWARGGLIAGLLDRAMASGALPPLSVVLVETGGAGRSNDLACSPAFVAALDSELLPELVDGSAPRAPERTIIGGASLGGLTALYAAMVAPHRFGVVYAQSGSFWWPNVAGRSEEQAWLTRCLATLPRLPLRIRLEAGMHERVVLTATRHLRDVLVAAGYDLGYLEVDGGHDRLWWAAHLPDGLRHLTRDW